MFRLLDVKIFLAVGATDMRKQVNGLSISIMVEHVLEQYLFPGHLFGFYKEVGEKTRVVPLWLRALRE